MKQDKMTRKNLNKLHAAAFEAFKAEYTSAEWEALFAGGARVISCWEVREGNRVERWLLQQSSQLNRSSLEDAGFNSANVYITHLFDVNRQTKTLNFPSNTQGPWEWNREEYEKQQ